VDSTNNERTMEADDDDEYDDDPAEWKDDGVVSAIVVVGVVGVPSCGFSSS